MMSDRLSEVLDFIEVRGIVSGSSAVHGRWESESLLDEDLKFFAVVQGRMRVFTNGVSEPLLLEAGDVAVLNGRSWLRLEGGPREDAADGMGDNDGAPVRLDPPASGTFVRVGEGPAGAADIIMGGRVAVNASGRELLLHALPPAAHLRSGTESAPHLQVLISRVFEEVSRPRMGSDFAVRQYGQLLVLEVLRAFIQEAELPAGWLKLLADERLRPAVALIHTQPSRPWTLQELAQAAAMSRTAFAERFRRVAGTPPRAYLNNWRMLTAQRALRSGDTRIRALALDAGFSSESAFSNAFKRSTGESPLHYRARMRAR